MVNQERLQPMLDDPKQFRFKLKLLNQANKVVTSTVVSIDKRTPDKRTSDFLSSIFFSEGLVVGAGFFKI